MRRLEKEFVDCIERKQQISIYRKNIKYDFGLICNFAILCRIKVTDRYTFVLKQSLVVYLIKYKDCEANYKGITEWIIFHRVRSH